MKKSRKLFLISLSLSIVSLITFSGCASTSTTLKVPNANEFDSKTNTYTYYQENIVIDVYDKQRVGGVKLILSYSVNSDIVKAQLFSSKIEDWNNFIIKSSDLNWWRGDKKQVTLADNCTKTENSLICELKKSELLKLKINRHEGVSLLVLTSHGIKIPTEVNIEQKDLNNCNEGEARLNERFGYRTNNLDHGYNKCIENAKYKAIQKLTSGTGFVSSLSQGSENHVNFFKFIDNISK